jgi:hypothetical protein
MGLDFREEGRGRSPKEGRFGLWVLAGIGMMIFLLSGCGSDSSPKGSASAKKEKEKDEKSGSTMQMVKPLLPPKAGGTAPPLAHVDNILPGMPPPKELEAKRAAAAAAWEKLDPKAIVFPGLTKEQFDANLEAERARKPDPNREIFPGLTQEQLNAKLKAHRERPATPVEILPGITDEQIKAKAAQARQMQETKSTRPEHVFPPR